MINAMCISRIIWITFVSFAICIEIRKYRIFVLILICNLNTFTTPSVNLKCITWNEILKYIYFENIFSTARLLHFVHVCRRPKTLLCGPFSIIVTWLSWQLTIITYIDKCNIENVIHVRMIISKYFLSLRKIFIL